MTISDIEHLFICLLVVIFSWVSTQLACPFFSCVYGICMCVCTSVCTCVWRPEVEDRRRLLTLLIEKGTLCCPQSLVTCLVWQDSLPPFQVRFFFLCPSVSWISRGINSLSGILYVAFWWKGESYLFLNYHCVYVSLWCMRRGLCASVPCGGHRETLWGQFSPSAYMGCQTCTWHLYLHPSHHVALFLFLFLFFWGKISSNLGWPQTY